MRLSEFILLGEKEKQHAILHRGILVAKRKQSDRIFFLFRLSDYYVETCCDTTNNSVTEYRMLTGAALLEPYLSGISLTSLLL